MATRTPVVSLAGLHDVLPGGDTLPGAAVQRSTDSGNALTLGVDGGLKVTQPSSVAPATGAEVVTKFPATFEIYLISRPAMGR